MSQAGCAEPNRLKAKHSLSDMGRSPPQRYGALALDMDRSRPPQSAMEIAPSSDVDRSLQRCRSLPSAMVWFILRGILVPPMKPSASRLFLDRPWRTALQCLRPGAERVPATRAQASS